MSTPQQITRELLLAKMANELKITDGSISNFDPKVRVLSVDAAKVFIKDYGDTLLKP